MLGVPTQLWGLWRSAENMNTLTVKVLGGSCHAACGPSFQGTVIQTNITVQVTHGRAPESLCVPHPHLSDNGYLRESLPFPGTSSPHLRVTETGTNAITSKVGLPGALLGKSVIIKKALNLTTAYYMAGTVLNTLYI